jgi:hypothetical protein
VKRSRYESGARSRKRGSAPARFLPISLGLHRAEGSAPTPHHAALADSGSLSLNVVQLRNRPGLCRRRSSPGKSSYPRASSSRWTEPLVPQDNAVREVYLLSGPIYLARPLSQANAAVPPAKLHPVRIGGVLGTSGTVTAGRRRTVYTCFVNRGRRGCCQTKSAAV